MGGKTVEMELCVKCEYQSNEVLNHSPNAFVSDTGIFAEIITY